MQEAFPSSEAKQRFEPLPAAATRVSHESHSWSLTRKILAFKPGPAGRKPWTTSLCRRISMIEKRAKLAFTHSIKMLINVMFVVLMFGFSIFPRAFVCEYFFCPFELLFALSRKEIKALSFFSIEFTIFQEFSVRLGSEMSFVTKWRLWSRKLYLLFP